MYDRSRPGYPEALFDDLVSLATLPAAGRILEVGCGTGQASVSLAERGYSLVCLEPGPSLASLARHRLARFPLVRVLESTLEAWPVERERFDLVVSAQAFHWVDPTVAFYTAAETLRPGGALAIIGSTVNRQESALRTSIDAAYARWAPDVHGAGASHWYGEAGSLSRLLGAADCFGPAATRQYAWSRSLSASRYGDLMRTQSNHRLLPRHRMEGLIAEISTCIAAHGGEIKIDYVTHLVVAPRVATFP